MPIKLEVYVSFDQVICLTLRASSQHPVHVQGFHLLLFLLLLDSSYFAALSHLLFWIILLFSLFIVAFTGESNNVQILMVVLTIPLKLQCRTHRIFSFSLSVPVQRTQS